MFHEQFFGNEKTDDKKLCAQAIPELEVGREITKKNKWKSGDFVQLWRKPERVGGKSSGHAVIFYKWKRNKTGKKVGFNYIGTQGSTGGIGLRTEYFSISGGKVLRDRTYAARIFLK